MIAHVLPPLRETYDRSGRIVWQACCLGFEPAESLHWIDREHLIDTLVLRGWKLQQIAGLTRQTLYTTARVARAAERVRHAQDYLRAVDRAHAVEAALPPAA